MNIPSLNDEAAGHKAEAEHFLTRLDESADDFLFACFDDSGAGRPAAQFYGDLDTHFSRLATLNDDGYGVYVTINTTDGPQRKAENIVQVRAVFRDWDKPEATRPPLPLEPSLVVCTSPGKFHDYVLVDDLNLSDFTPVQRRLVSDYGSDSQVIDLPRVMRLPGFVNQKPDVAGHRVAVVQDSGSQAATAEQVLAALPPVIVKAVKSNGADPSVELPADEWQKIGEAMRAIGPDCGYDEWLKVGQALHATGDPRAFNRWNGWSKLGAKYQGEAELQRKWAGFTAGRGVTLKTLFYTAIQHGWNVADLTWLAATTTEGENEAAQVELDRRVGELAKLTKLAYDKVRVDAAKELGVRASTLDAEVREARGDTGVEAGQAVTFSDPEPADEPVDTAELLDDVLDELQAHVVLPPGGYTAAALWILFTWTIDAFDAAPLLLLTSPEKRCGKTKTLGVLSRLVRRPLATSNSSPAALFRVIEEHCPTLLIDEGDTFLVENQELRGVINSGFTRDAAFVLRSEGDAHEVRQFSTWAPKVIAMIKEPADTIMDRAIIVALQRKPKNQKVKRLRHRTRYPELCARLRRWSTDHLDELRQAEPGIPETLDDRASDKWEPLLAIADLAGEIWAQRAREAALALSAAADDASQPVALLADTKAIFSAEGNAEHLTTEVLLNKLCLMEERPWPAYGRSCKSLTPRQLAKLLKPFGVRPKNVGSGNRQAKGYLAADLVDAWERYL